jgi:hypothetical protein
MKDSLRSAVSLTIRPVWRRIWARIEARFQPVETRLHTSEERLSAVEQRVIADIGPDSDVYGRLEHLESRVSQFESGWRQHAAQFLNAVSTVGAYGHALISLKKQAEQENKVQSAEIAGLREELIRRLSEAQQQLGEVQRRLGETQQRLDAHVEAAGTDIGALKERVPTLQKALEELQRKAQSGDPLVETVEAEWAKLEALEGRAANTDNSIAALWERIEFIRRETLFEMNYGRPAGAGSRDKPARVVNPEKLKEAMQNGLRINLGCGHIPLDGYINIDQRDLPGVDVVSDVDDMPIDPNTVQELFSSHLIEHFPQEMLRRRLLPYWKSLLAPGGTFRAVVPDGEAMLRGISRGTYPFEDFREVLFGAQDYDGDFHFNMLTPASFTHLMREAGFTDITVPVQGRPNGKCFEFEIAARV